MMEINGNRLWESLMEMAEIGATEKGGCRRLALTDLDRQGRDLFAVSYTHLTLPTIGIDRSRPPGT